MAVPLLIAAVAISAVGAVQQGMAASQANNYNATLANRNATVAVQQSEQDAEAQRRAGIMAIGAQRAQYGASGVTEEGSPLDVLSSTASLAERDRQTILYKGKLRALGYTDEAGLDTARASNALMGGFAKAGGAVISGGANTIKLYGDGSSDVSSPLAPDVQGSSSQDY